MPMKVTGQAVCDYCRGDIAAMASKAEVNSLKILKVE